MKCHCGCGETTPIATRTRCGNVKGEHVRFCRGHAPGRSMSDVEFEVEDCGFRTPCRIWQRSTTNGYGYRSVDGRLRRVHVVEWEKVNGPVPAGLELDHLCGQRACAEVTHLEPVTRAENLRRGRGSKLTTADVEAIRSLRGTDLAALADRFGVHRTTIGDVLSGRTWAAAAIGGNEMEGRNNGA